jgi:hypothetical protein
MHPVPTLKIRKIEGCRANEQEGRNKPSAPKLSALLDLPQSFPSLPFFRGR